MNIARDDISSSGKPVAAKRLTLSFRRGGWFVSRVSSTPPTILPESHLKEIARDRRDRAGTWFEVENALGQVVYSQIIENPYQQVLEGTGPDGRFMGRVVGVRQPSISILVPHLPDGGRVKLYSSLPRPTRTQGVLEDAAMNLLDFDLGTGGGAE